MDKFALIYEFDKSSPLFAYIAQKELESNNYEKAREVIEEGLQIYPDYSVALIVYAKILAATGNLENAKTNLLKACDIIDSEETYKYYLAEIEKMFANYKVEPEISRTTFVPEELNFAIDENPKLDESPVLDDLAEIEAIIKGQLFDDELFKENSIETIQIPNEDDLDKLAEELSNAHMPPPQKAESEELPEIEDVFEVVEEPIVEEKPAEREIVSETLAGIYFAQGNYKEALSLYTKLVDYNPAKADFFKKRIRQINEILDKG